MRGRIIKIISNLYTVSSEDKTYECRARGLFRNKEQTPLVGDIVEFSPSDNYILEIMPRRNELKRPTVVNIDKAIVVTSCKKPDFSSLLLDKMLTNIILSDVEPIIVFSKYDLLNEEEKIEFDKLISYYNEKGYEALLNTDIEKLEKLISGNTVVLTGQTGAGKSSLLNKLDDTLNLATDEISEALGRGKHTTRHVELFNVKDYFVADTPGFSALDVIDDVDNIRFAFKEFNNDGCKFRDCKHINEIGCAVKEQVESGEILKFRYENYKSMVIK